MRTRGIFILSYLFLNVWHQTLNILSQGETRIRHIRYTVHICHLRSGQKINQPTTELIEGRDLREIVVDVRRAVQPFLRLPRR